jgi:hypothetical protein
VEIRSRAHTEKICVCVCVSESGSVCERGSALRFKFRVLKKGVTVDCMPVTCVCVCVWVFVPEVRFGSQYGERGDQVQSSS